MQNNHNPLCAVPHFFIWLLLMYILYGILLKLEYALVLAFIIW